MNFDWGLYIQLADELINHQKTASLKEAYYRCAISRSYYGVFCIARNFLVSKGTAIPKVDTHKFVRDEYNKSINRNEKKIGDDLGRLWKERKNADYENDANINEVKSKTAYQLSLRILCRLNQIGAI